MNENRFIVYVVTNVANGHRYVGYTAVGLARRKYAHFGKARSKERGCPKFHNAIRKYGEAAFAWQIVASFNNMGEALAEEIRLIAELRPEYNLTAGGEGLLGVPSANRKTVTCLEDGSVFVSATEAATHYAMSVVTLTDACNGKNRTAKGMHFVWGDLLYNQKSRDAIIARIEAAHAKRRKQVKKNINHPSRLLGRDSKGRKTTGPDALSKKVLCVDTDTTFPSASEAARAYNVAKSSIIELCLGKNNRKSVGGHIFKYVEHA